jgi:hypothetical protein
MAYYMIAALGVLVGFIVMEIRSVRRELFAAQMRIARLESR